ncbi:hypothetical protein JCM8547_004084 [Rhodosporidiobolus lusitaniae]
MWRPSAPPYEDDKHSLDASSPRFETEEGGKPGIRLLGNVDQSQGIARIEAINAELTPVLRFFLFLGAFLVAYTYSLDATVRGTLQTYATNDFDNHSLLATVNVLKAIVAATSYPVYAKIADTFGHIEIVCFSIVMYVVGTIVESQAHGMETFCAGAVLWQFGYSASILIVEIIISDLTSLRSRLFYSYLPALPFLVNTWVSGDIVSATYDGIGWRAGIGLWAGVYPAACCCILVPLFIAQRRARKASTLDGYLTPYKQVGAKKLAINLFHELDLVGSFLLLASLILVLLPFTLAGGVSSQWKTGKVLGMLIVGLVVAVPAFIVWELKFAKVPAVPFHLLNNRTVLGCLGLAVSLNLGWYMQGDYLYTVLVVAMNESAKSATRIASLYSFTSVITGTICGLVVRFVLPRLKLFIIAGVCSWFIAFGLLINYRGGDGSHSGIIGAQVVLGVAGGLYPYPAQTLIQTAGQHQHTAILLSLYLATYNVGSALGGAISGAIWTQVLPGKLEQALGGNMTDVAIAYGSPLSWILENTWETAQRQAAVEAWRHVQKLLCITGICFAVPTLFFALILKDPKLGKEQSLPEAEGGRKVGNVVKVDRTSA